MGVPCAMTALGLITAGLGTAAAAAPPSSYLVPSQDRLPAAIRLPGLLRPRCARAEKAGSP